jgi:hypothetical protein
MSVQWTGYLAAAAARESSNPDSNEIAAGTACHVESGYLQEIAMEAAMSERQHVWVDGSLSDGDWYSKVSPPPSSAVTLALSSSLCLIFTRGV